MSSNKTIIPGMEDAYTEQSNFGMGGGNAQDGTKVPNMMGATSSNANVSNSKPVIGFLYSISKSASGEFWPLHIGSNHIGRSNKCDVNLGEATVSEQHAVLVIQQMKNPEKVIAWINDSGSTCGTMINGESLGFDRRECFNGDIITIGEHYDLLFILIDSKQLGLNVCRDYIPVQPQNNGYRPNDAVRNPYEPTTSNKHTQEFRAGSANSQKGTVGFDEQDDGSKTKPGGTIFM